MARRVVSFLLLLQLAQAASEGNFTLQFVEEQIQECGKSWGCYRRACEPTNITQCEYAAMYKPHPASNSIEFILSTSKGDYAALGFSADQRMGEDEVIACIRGSAGTIAQHYYNPKQHYASRTSKWNYLSLNASLSENGQLFCHITRSISGHTESDYFDMATRWYHLYAFGPVDESNKIKYHEPVHRAPTSDRKYSLFHDFPNVFTIRSASSPLTSTSAVSVTTTALSFLLVVLFNL